MKQPFNADHLNDDHGVGALSTFVQESDEQQTSPFRKIHAKLRGRYLWAISLGIVGSLAAGGGVYFKFNPKFMSRGLLRIAPVMPRMIYRMENSSVMPMFDAFVGTQVELITSQRVMHKAMDSDEWKAYGRGLTPDSQANFSEALEVLRPPRTNIIFVTFTDRSPKVAVTAVKSMIEAYKEIFGERDIVSGEDRLTRLETLRVNLFNKLKSKRDRIQATSDEYGSSAYGQMYQWKIAELSQLNDQITQIKAALDAAGETEVEPAVPDAADGVEATDISPEQLARTDRVLMGLLTQRDDFMAILERDKMIHGWGDNHPEVLAQKANIEFMNTRIARYVQTRKKGTIAGAVTDQGDAGNLSRMTPHELRSQLDRFNERYRATNEVAKMMSRKNFRIRTLEEEARQVQQSLLDVTERIEKLNIESQSKVGGRIDVISYGELPMVPINRGKRKQLILFAVVGGGILGSSLVLLVGVLDRRLRSSEDAQESMGRIRVLGILPGLPDDLSDPEHARIAGMCVHHIRTMLQLDTSRPDRKVYAITSPAAGTGKTSLTLALGLSFAASGSRTLLVDCDLSGGGLTSRLRAIIRRRVGQILQRQGLLTPHQLEEALQHAAASGNRLGESLINLGVLSQEDLDRALNIQEDARIGLLDALDGEDFDHCVAQTSSKGLSILPIGGANAYDMSRLSPSAVRRVVDMARQRFDVILLDAGPIPSTVETSIVAAEADDVVLVVSRGDQKPLAESAISFLESIGAHIAGVVFNRAAAGDVARSVHAISTSASTSPIEDNEDGPTPPTGTGSEHFGPVARAVVNTSSATGDRT